MSFFGGGASSSSNTITPAAGDKDIEVADPPADSISSISFSSAADYLAVGSWDNNVSDMPALFSQKSNPDMLASGSYIRGRCERADAGQSIVLPPGTRSGCLLEQGALLISSPMDHRLTAISGG